ncbi:DNA binding domain protein, excisionase family [Stanieria cyanosphaera PCC 7437]|uniref:DNA binding domain protein, excisionase family n=1 Tax=Stanieria cyanosphaera (strain ATCC 29371 / PCC 7437) TaxID=111780 RepID=K9XQ65_STAC7|nr:helix-turn-helix domain-containing protein [Stanieria cyanosphaera]AFZ34658.1 DNA binding domain protein, excisionase family [Stanieria cyanosphaera PCC 7437]
MSKQLSSFNTLKPKKNETSAIKKLEKFLTAEKSLPKLISSTGEEIVLPESVYNALYQVVEAMASGNSITISPLDQEMTTQEAADLLNVSRPYLIKLLEQGEIPHTKVGKHRRINCRDIFAYKQLRDRQRSKSLSEFTAFLQEEGFYDEDTNCVDE